MTNDYEDYQPMDDADVGDYDFYSEHSDGIPRDQEDYDDSMDGDHESALASAGFGTDEDYGFYDDGCDDVGDW